MSSAIERLVAEMMNLSADEWERLLELRRASQDWDVRLERAAIAAPDNDKSIPRNETPLGILKKTPP
jgi:hypothetical protein